jgi:predicted histone-like DNA-binding protein
LDQLAIHISKRGTVTRSDVYATLISMLEVIPELLLDNYTIDMCGMGIFSLHINGRPSDTPEEVNESKIKNVNIAYRPGKEIKTKIGHAKFTIRK